MQRQISKISICIGAAAMCAPLALAAPAEAKSKVKPPKVAQVFDAAKRKKAKHKLSDAVSYSAYANIRYLGERDIARDDNVRDSSDETAIYLGFVGRAQLSHSVMAFAHAEVSLKDRRTHDRSFGRIMDPQLKEALVAVSLSQTDTLTFGRMRFSDANKWVLDASVDGVHYARKTPGKVLEFAAFKGTTSVSSYYAMAHYGRADELGRWGGLALAESDGDAKRLHVAGYWEQRVTTTFRYQATAGAVFGDAANGKNFGVGFDVRAIKKLSDSKLKPQITFGFAYGSEGFQQSGLHSNKTYDGGQTQFHRYGYVYQPELTNLAVLSLGVGVRPSKKFSADLVANAYFQPSASTTGPSARLNGITTGNSHFLGTEISLVGAFRPSKKTKVEFGAGRFDPGPAYLDQSPATRVFARISVYF